MKKGTVAAAVPAVILTVVLSACGDSLPDRLVFAGYSSLIGSVELDGTGEHTILNTGYYPVVHVAVDPFEQKLYWSGSLNGGYTYGIGRADMDGSHVESLLATSSAQPAGVDVDPWGQKLYWSERFTDRIQVSGLDGSNVHVLIEGTQEPRGLCLDLLTDHVYWVEYGTNRVRRADLDGGNVVDVVIQGVTRPFDVAVDPLHGKLYWSELGASSDNQHGSVFMANLDGSDPVRLVTDQYQPANVAVDPLGGHIYWCAGSYIRRADLDGSNITQFLQPTGGALALGLDIDPIPEPATLALLAAGGWAALRRRRKPEPVKGRTPERARRRE